MNCKWWRRYISDVDPKVSRVITVLPKGTVVKFDGIPCELLQDTPYYSATFQKYAEARRTPRPEGKEGG